MILDEPVRLEGVHCTITIEALKPRLLRLEFVGRDVGEFGDIPRQHLEALLPKEGGCELFIDARDVKGVSIDVSSEWAQWFNRHRARFSLISMLTGSPFIEVTADFVRRFAELGDRMRIYVNARAFDEALVAARENLG